MEKIISNIKGVEYVYSTSMKGQAMLIIQFYVGEDVERSLVKLYSELMKNMDKMPAGVTMPLIKTRAIDDVPVLGLTLWSEHYDDYRIKQIGQQLTNEIKKITDVSDINILGGRNRQLKVIVDKDKMAQNHIDLLSIAKALQGGNSQAQSGTLYQRDTAFSVETGNFLTSADDVAGLVVGINGQQPVYLKQVATVTEGPQTPSQFVLFGYGNADTSAAKAYRSTYPAVTLAINKKKGADAMALSEKILAKVERLKKDLIPSDVQVTVTRNYGETASAKVSPLGAYQNSSMSAGTTQSAPASPAMCSRRFIQTTC
jgi:multidrug efflux pump subunit AcrB